MIDNYLDNSYCRLCGDETHGGDCQKAAARESEYLLECRFNVENLPSDDDSLPYWKAELADQMIQWSEA